MDNAVDLVHTVITVAVIVILIARFRVNPALSLLAGTIYLALATGMGYVGTLEALSTGFGGILAEVGLIIGLGVIMGSLLNSMGAVHMAARVLLRVASPRGLPYVVSSATTFGLQSIQPDALIVIIGSLAKRIAARTGQSVSAVAGALAIGVHVGCALVFPGAVILFAVGVLDAPVGETLLIGALIAVPTVLLSTALYLWMLRRKLWDITADVPKEVAAVGATSGGGEQPRPQAISPTGDEDQGEPEEEWPYSFGVVISPLVVTLFLIAGGTIASLLGWNADFIVFVSNPIFALFVGAFGAYVLARRASSADVVESRLVDALRQSGPILMITGVSGCLATVIAASELNELLGGLFEVGWLSPLLLIWIIAALVRLAQGSGGVAAITALAIVAPALEQQDVSLALAALAAAAGAAFFPHVVDNTFWLFRSAVGLTTTGTFRVYSVPLTIVSVLSIAFILVADLLMSAF